MAPLLLFLKPFSPSDRAFLTDRLSATYRIVEPPAFDEETLCQLVAEADVALGNGLSPRVARAAKRLRLLQVPAAGVDGVDLEFLTELQIAVCNSHSAASCVAEHIVALLLDLVRRISAHDRLLRAGTWFCPSGKTTDVIHVAGSLVGATVGFLGYGRIGKAARALLTGFNIEAIACTRGLGWGAQSDDCSVVRVSLDDIFQRADALIISVPLTKDTAGMVSARQLLQVKPTMCLVSVSRAPVVNADALFDALRARRLAGAALDGWERGHDGIERFALLDNVVLSPHRAGTRIGVNPALDGAVDNLLAYARTGDLQNRIDPSAGY